LSECLGEDVADASIAADRDPWITGIATDSRRVRSGDLFIASRGAAHDGHDFVDAAVANGATAVLAERDLPSAQVLVVKTRDTRRAAGRIAARFFDHPSRTLGCIGVTGTNGKTSVTQFAAMLLTAAGKPAGYGGTLGWNFAGKHCPADLTTEDGVTVQRRLADLVSAWRRVGCDGSQFARVGSGSSGRRRIRRRGIHEPDARSPRLSRNDGTICGGKAPTVRMADVAQRCGELGTTRKVA
jgi:UDP-N-acetylmuramyl tripeptide synthase